MHVCTYVCSAAEAEDATHLCRNKQQQFTDNHDGRSVELITSLHLYRKPSTFLAGVVNDTREK